MATYFLSTFPSKFNQKDKIFIRLYSMFNVSRLEEISCHKIGCLRNRLKVIGKTHDSILLPPTGIPFSLKGSHHLI